MRREEIRHLSRHVTRHTGENQAPHARTQAQPPQQYLTHAVYRPINKYTYLISTPRAAKIFHHCFLAYSADLIFFTACMCSASAPNVYEPSTVGFYLEDAMRKTR